jgi:hypothetical protein
MKPGMVVGLRAEWAEAFRVPRNRTTRVVSVLGETVVLELMLAGLFSWPADCLEVK